MSIFFLRKKHITKTQPKTETAGTASKTVYPDVGYDGLSSVTINPTPSETKTASAHIDGTTNNVTPSSGKLLSKVTINPVSTEEIEVTADTSAKVVTPTAGKLISKATINPTPSTSVLEFVEPDQSYDKEIVPDKGKLLSKVWIRVKSHTTTFRPDPDKANNDMGARHAHRYVDTSGMIVPVTEEIEVTADTSAKVVTPSTGKFISKATINPTPSETKTASAHIDGTKNDVTPSSGKLLSKVSINPVPTETKTKVISPGTKTAETVTPSSGKLLSSVSVSVSDHESTFYPTTIVPINDMGAKHAFRYVDLTDWAKPSGEITLDDAGTYDVTQYKTAVVTAQSVDTEEIEVTADTSAKVVTPTAGKLISKATINPTPSTTILETVDPNLAGDKEIVPPSGKLLSKVWIRVKNHTTTYRPTPNKADNDMGAKHLNRYVDTSGMIVPTGTLDVIENGTYDVTQYETAEVNVPPMIHTSTYRPEPDTANNDMGKYHSYRYVDTRDMVVPAGSMRITNNNLYQVDVGNLKYVDILVEGEDARFISTAADIDISNISLSGAAAEIITVPASTFGVTSYEAANLNKNNFGIVETPRPIPRFSDRGSIIRWSVEDYNPNTGILFILVENSNDWEVDGFSGPLKVNLNHMLLNS